MRVLLARKSDTFIDVGGFSKLFALMHASYVYLVFVILLWHLSHSQGILANETTAPALLPDCLLNSLKIRQGESLVLILINVFVVAF